MISIFINLGALCPFFRVLEECNATGVDAQLKHYNAIYTVILFRYVGRCAFDIGDGGNCGGYNGSTNMNVEVVIVAKANLANGGVIGADGRGREGERGDVGVIGDQSVIRGSRPTLSRQGRLVVGVKQESDVKVWPEANVKVRRWINLGGLMSRASERLVFGPGADVWIIKEINVKVWLEADAKVGPWVNLETWIDVRHETNVT
ncbi:hypothetical protein RIF29_10855 [Crotalaria pallida]|uniref:Uncharacterized protein n=1 Tax=Crotalaria pallida TaxID=3830 RepID=A0AAN9FW65_CROPI